MSLTNNDVKPIDMTDIVLSSEYESTTLSGIRTKSGYIFYDNSTLNDFRVCPRKGYFKHIRKFAPSGIAMPLIFGGAWHSAMDVLWPLSSKGIKKNQVIEESFEAFLKFWANTEASKLDEFTLNDLYFPRVPTKALELLSFYFDEYGESLLDYEIATIELPFIVPLTNDETKLMYIGRIDKDVMYKGGPHEFFDHKTGSALETMWTNSFSPNDQFDGYFHAGKMLYGNSFHSITVDGIQVHKTKKAVKRLPLLLQIPQVEGWLWETLEQIGEIEYNEKLLLEYRESGKHQNFLPAFPKNCTACANQYGKPCPYRDLCVYQNNPEDHEMMDAFEPSTWVPFQIEEKQTKDGMIFNVDIKEGD